MMPDASRTLSVLDEKVNSVSRAVNMALERINGMYPSLLLEYLDRGGALEGIDGYLIDKRSRKVIDRIEVKRWNPGYVVHDKRIRDVITSKGSKFTSLITSANLDYRARKALSGKAIVSFDYALDKLTGFANRIERHIIRKLRRLCLIQNHLVMNSEGFHQVNYFAGILSSIPLIVFASCTSDSRPRSLLQFIDSYLDASVSSIPSPFTFGKVFLCCQPLISK